MAGQWRKLGRIFAGPDGRHPALVSHAALPIAVPLHGDLVRIFYSGRDARNRSAVGTLVLRLGEVPRIEDQPPEPVLLPGDAGAFDDAGISVGSVVVEADADRLYYMGWNIGGSVPWRNAIGVAFGDARAGRFERGFAGPLMDRDRLDAYSLSYPYVMRLAPGDWRMWYGTHLAWGDGKSDMRHAIREARSLDGLAWHRLPGLAVSPEGMEIATVRPSVHRLPGGNFDMWFSMRAADGPYAIGRAASVDGHSWTRIDPGIAAEADGWEAGTLAYPHVFEQLDRRWMLFNGAGYGATGIGLALWEA